MSIMGGVFVGVRHTVLDYSDIGNLECCLDWLFKKYTIFKVSYKFKLLVNKTKLTFQLLTVFCISFKSEKTDDGHCKWLNRIN